MTQRVHGMVACTLTSLTLATSPAEATFTIDPSPSAQCIGSSAGTLSQPGPATASLAGPSSVNLAGDANFVITDLSVPGLIFSCVGNFDIDVSDLPVQIEPVWTSDFKFVLGGGSSTEPTVSIVPSLAFFVPGPSTPIPELEGSDATTTQVGNGLSIVSGGFSTGPFILGPDLMVGSDYAVELHFDVFLDAAAGGGLPSPVVSVEYGGTTAFGGFTVDFQAQTVPEPATALLLGLGLAAIAIGRRHAVG